MTAFSDLALAYLRDRGIVPEFAASVGVGEEPAGVIIWPTVDADGRPSPRRRTLTGDGPKVRGEAGRSLAPWWPAGTPRPADTVLVCEGESDALAACCALASPEEDPDGSVRVLRSFVSAVVAVPGTSFPPDRLLAALRDVGAREVVLAFDADDAGRKATSRYGDALAAAGVSCCVLSLPDDRDLAGCLAGEERPASWLANGIADAAAVREEVAPSAELAGRFQLLTVEDLLTLPDPSWLIDGLVPASGLSVLYGASGAGKSFVALDWALCVAAGLTWFGRKVERRPVVYVAAEGRAGLKARYRAWSSSRGGPDVSRIRFLPEAVNLLERETVRDVRFALDTLPERPGLLVVDTMARTMVGGDENAAKDVGEFIAAVDRLRGDNAALVVHHAGKDGGLERGSSALRAAADLVAKAERKKGRRVELSCEKMKDAPEWDGLSLRLEDVAGSCALSLVMEAEAARDDLEDVVLAAVAEIGPASKNKIAEKVGRQRQAVLRLVDALDAAGKVRATAEGWEVVPAAPELPRNHLSADHGGGGSQPGARDVVPPGWEPPQAGPSPEPGTAGPGARRAA